MNQDPEAEWKRLARLASERLGYSTVRTYVEHTPADEDDPEDTDTFRGRALIAEGEWSSTYEWAQLSLLENFVGRLKSRIDHDQAVIAQLETWIEKEKKP